MDDVVYRHEVTGRFDREWWINRTRQFEKANASLTLTPASDGSWRIDVYVEGSGNKTFGGIFSEKLLQEKLFEARIWANKQCPAYEGAQYPWPTRDSLPLKNWGK